MLKKIKRNIKKITKKSINILRGIVTIPMKSLKFLKNVWQELKLVSWLTRRETFKWTSAVLFTALAIGLLIVLLDIGFYNLRNLLFKI